MTLGRALQRCRLRFLPQLADRTNALILGDGDGRFLAALLKQNPALTADAIDTSAAMLDLLRSRCRRIGASIETRLQTHHSDALSYLASTPCVTCDLVVTHFFLDCLTQPELESLAIVVRARLTPGAIWLLSDFRIPPGRLHQAAKFYVQSLYLVFRILTGLQVRRLPDHASALGHAGFTRIAQFCSLLGLLSSELWIYEGPTRR